MPELPEVETIRMGLEKYLTGHVIEDVEVRLLKMVSGNTSDIIKAHITAVRRFGKGLVIDLSNDFSIAVHIKMTGQLIYQGPGVPAESVPDREKVGKLPGPFTHVIFHLGSKQPDLTQPYPLVGEGKAVLYFNDMRQFGWIKILPTKAVPELPFFKELGPEPAVTKVLADRPVLTLSLFQTILKKTRAPIKPVLMDQKRIGGIGNIYANDALFLSKIDPKRPANSLTLDEQKKLLDAIESVLKKGLAAGGSSEWSYVNALGQTGEYQKIFVVYGRDGQPCAHCGARIEKIQFGGRGTYFCSKCQT